MRFLITLVINRFTSYDVGKFLCMW